MFFRRKSSRAEQRPPKAMPHSRSIPALSVLVLFISLAIFCFSPISSLDEESSHLHHNRHASQVPDGNLVSQHSDKKPRLPGGEHDNGWMPLGGSRRSLADEATNSSLILAAKRTKRKDPLDNFKLYTGGWNITNQHYWASVGLTAAPFFTLAGVWFVLFGVVLGFICLCHCCFRREVHGYSSIAYSVALALLIIFTLAAITGSIVLYLGQGKLHNSIINTLDYVVDQANTTAENLRNVSDYLAAAKDIDVDRVFLPADVQTNIDAVQSKINSSASKLGSKTLDNSRKIKDVLAAVGLALILVAACMLFLAFLGFLFSILGCECLVYSLVILGWFLVAGMLILCGVFLLLHNAIADSCIAMDQWVLNPTAQTALDEIIPCVDNATAQETLTRSKDVTYQLVDVVNKVIRNVSNANFPSAVGPPLYFNQSGPLVPLLCNPYNSDLTDRPCTSGEVDFNNATQVWKGYMCQVSSSGVCLTPGRLTPDIYSQSASAVNVSYGLYHYGPFLISLEDCTFVRQTLSDITADDCPGLRRYTMWIYTGSVLLAASVMFSVIFWLVYARQREHRETMKEFAS